MASTLKVVLTLTLNLLNYLNGIIHLSILELSLSFLIFITRQELEVGEAEPTVKSLVRLYLWERITFGSSLVKVKRVKVFFFLLDSLKHCTY